MEGIFRRYPIGIQSFEDLRNNNCVYSFQEIALFVAKRLSPLDDVLSTATSFGNRLYATRPSSGSSRPMPSCVAALSSRYVCGQ